MKIKISILVLCFNILFSIISNAKDNYSAGYIITNIGDTIQGQIKQKSNYINSKECEFSESQSHSYIKYLPIEIKGYGLQNGQYYVSKNIKLNDIEQEVFIEYLLKGAVNLYFLKTNNNSIYYIEKDSTLYELTNENVEIVRNDIRHWVYSEKYKGMLTYLFNDSPESIKKTIPNLNFNHKALINITRDYNNIVCNEYECITYTKNARNNWFIEVNGFMDYNILGLTDSKDHLYNFSPGAALYLRFIPGDFFKAWNVVLGAEYHSTAINGNLTTQDIYSTNYKIDLDITYLSIPLFIEYSIAMNKLRPALAAGISYEFVNDYNYMLTYYNDHIQFNSTKYYDDISNFSISPTFSLGLKYFNKSSYWIFKFEYKYSFLLSESILYKNTIAKLTPIKFSVGYGFKL